MQLCFANFASKSSTCQGVLLGTVKTAVVQLQGLMEEEDIWLLGVNTA